MEKKLTQLLLLLAAITITGCKRAATLPDTYDQLTERADIWPDYTDIVVPPNIAPLNFIVRDSAATACVVLFQGGGERLVVGAAKDGTVQVDSTAWRTLLEANKGADIAVDVYAQHEGGWVKFQGHTLSVAPEPIDAYLSYRLIEPGYELYRQLGLYQRNLTGWDVHTIYENNLEYADDDNHCINCHNYRQGSTESMLFHVRSNHGGTIIVQHGEAHKVQIKDSTIITAGVYPSWHPTENLVAFSTNKTGQTFHIYHPEKIEVMDEASDLLLYDVTRNEVSHILRSPYDMETFPNWSPDGRHLYYCHAKGDKIFDPSLPDSLRGLQLCFVYDSVYYDLKRLPFDIETRTFGEPETVIDAASQHKSITLPRVSPDGRYVLYTLGDYGQFHIWHKSSDLWVKDLQTDSCYALSAANSPDSDSFHSWSTNGRWIAFSSRRMDGNYTRIFLAYFDHEGRAHKAFPIPQEDPMMNTLLLKSYNVPELTRDAVSIPQSALRQCIYETEGEPARYLR